MRPRSTMNIYRTRNTHLGSISGFTRGFVHSKKNGPRVSEQPLNQPHPISHQPRAISHAPSASHAPRAISHAPQFQSSKLQPTRAGGGRPAGGKRGGRALRAQPRALSPLPKVPLGPRPWLASGPKAVEDGRGRGFRRVLRKAGHGRRGCSVSCRIECRLPRPGSSARRDWPFTKARVDGCRL